MIRHVFTNPMRKFEMKLHPVFLAISAAIALHASVATAQESLWQNSYQFESAGKYTEAMNAIDSVAANGADAELKLLRRGWLFYLPGRFDESIREYRLAVERNPKSIDARLGLTLPLLAAKRWREAEQAARAVLEIVPNSYAGQIRLVTAQEGQQDWAGMLRTANSLVTSFPSDATAFVYLARANAWLGKRSEAATAYQAVLSRYPGHLEAKAYIEKK
jgi:tetratricopeptide (TPR) repeat protein